MFGYKSVQDYYDKVSVDQYIQDFAVPTFAFGAQDDVLMDHKVIPFEKIEAKGSQVFLATSKLGAHGNHMTGLIQIEMWP